MEQHPGIVTNIRDEEKQHILSLVQPGTFIQVCGPPMVGKSTLVHQAVSIDQSIQKERQNLFYHFSCKHANSLKDVLLDVTATLDEEELFTGGCQCPKEIVLQKLRSVVQAKCDHNHVFIFDKCANLSTPDSKISFLEFLAGILDLYWSSGLCVTVIVTTFKKFHIAGRHTRRVEVNVLTDLLDVVHLLRHYAGPGVGFFHFEYVCLKLFCFPEAIAKLSRKYLANIEDAQSLSHLQQQYPGTLEELLSLDADILSQIFEERTPDVRNWVTQADLRLLAAVGQSSFREEDLWRCYAYQYPGHVHSLWLLKLKQLKESYIIREGTQAADLIVHPLVAYYIQAYWPRHRMSFSEEFVLSSTTFLCHVIKRTQENMLRHRRRGSIHGCHVNDWPVIQELLQMAMHSHSYSALIKVAVMGRDLIISSCPNESRQFYLLVYNLSRVSRNKSHSAVLEICLAQALEASKEIDLPLALKHLDSAIRILQRRGPNFFHKMALWKKGRILEKLGDHNTALKYFQEAERVRHFQRMTPDEILQVTDSQEVEDSVSMEIQRIIPLIFIGNNTEAKEKLMELYETIHYRYENHPDFAAVLNCIGLTLQRGTKDMNEALRWYRKSYEERCILKNICPQLMVPTLNNMAMILCRQGDTVAGEKYLREALNILNEVGPNQYYTALTLTHFSEVKVKQGNFDEAYKATQKAEGIIQRTNKNHDFRLKISLTLVHQALILGNGQLDSGVAIPSVDESIDSLIRLSGQVKDYLSDDGHHYLMSSYEHGLLLHWRSSETKFQLYKEDLLTHVEEHQFLKDVLFTRNSKTFPSSLLADHMDFLEYIRNTEYIDLEFQKLLVLLLKACPFCRNIKDKIEEKVWEKEVERLSLDKQRRDNLNVEDLFLDFSNNSLSSTSDSIQIISGSDLTPHVVSQPSQGRPFVDVVTSALNSEVIIQSHQSLTFSKKVMNPSDFEEISMVVALPDAEWPSVFGSWEIISSAASVVGQEQGSFYVLNASSVHGGSPVATTAETPQVAPRMATASAFAEISGNAFASDLTHSYAEVMKTSSGRAELREKDPANVSQKECSHLNVANPSVDIEGLISSGLSPVTGQSSNATDISGNVARFVNHPGNEDISHIIVNASYCISNTQGRSSNPELRAEITHFNEPDSTNCNTVSPHLLDETSFVDLPFDLPSLSSDPVYSLGSDENQVAQLNVDLSAI